MNFSRKVVLPILIIAAGLLSSITMTAGTARGEASYRGLELVPEIIVSDELGLLTLNVAHGRGNALNQILVSSAAHRKNLDEIASIVLDSDAQVVAGYGLRFLCTRASRGRMALHLRGGTDVQDQDERCQVTPVSTLMAYRRQRLCTRHQPLEPRG